MKTDVAIVGGGPAGLAVAIHAARRGLGVVVLERRSDPPDKACGEGIMPPGVRALRELGARWRLDPRDASVLDGIRYVQEDGTCAEARLPDGGGLGVRRVALVGALAACARTHGATLLHGVIADGHRRVPDGIAIDVRDGSLGRVEAKLLVAADGLASPLRRAEGLDLPSRGRRRFGLRRHFRLEPWTRFVEVHLADGLEAYVTPVGSERVGVAFLWYPGAGMAAGASFDGFLDRFPALKSKLSGAAPESSVRGAGPFLRTCRARVADRFVLVGDAAGYVDAITGEGISLAFGQAAALGRILPEALARGAPRSALASYERAVSGAFRKYALFARAVLAVERRSCLRRGVVAWLAAHPAAFERVIGWAIA